jgi:hypothetical protein
MVFLEAHILQSAWKLLVDAPLQLLVLAEGFYWYHG